VISGSFKIFSSLPFVLADLKLTVEHCMNALSLAFLVIGFVNLKYHKLKLDL